MCHPCLTYETSDMPIVYAAVAEDATVVVESQMSDTKTDFSKVILVLLERMEHRNHKKSYCHEGYLLPLKYFFSFSLSGAERRSWKVDPWLDMEVMLVFSSY